MTVGSTLERARVQFGGRCAMVTPKGEQRTYAEFHQRVMRAAGLLAAHGVAQGDRVAVLLLNSPEYLELVFATAALGAVVVPMNTRLGADEMVFWLDDSASKVLVVDDRFAGPAAQLLPKLAAPPALIFAGQGECPPGMTAYESAAAAPATLPEVNPEDLAGLFYTSGTTGGPKGVMLTHRNLCAHALHTIIAVGIDSGWRYLHAAPMFHLANGSMMFAVVMRGGCSFFLPSFEPEAFLKTVAAHQVTATVLVPTMVNFVMNHPTLTHYDTTSLRKILYGASPMPLDLLRRGMEHFGPVFQQGYGLSEAAPLLTVLDEADHRMENLDEVFTPVKSAGRPMLGVEVLVVDAEGRPVPAGTMGEIIARGDNVMKGYWNRPEISANMLRGGWLHTGDMGAFDEQGYLYILDRAKDMIKTGGENVHSPEVESVLYAHAAVLEAAVIGIPDERWGEAIKAVVVCKPGATATADELITFCRQRLTHFKCPTSIDFADALPKGGTGKIQKNKLREPYWAGHAKGVN